ncbi:MAG: tetratricopeptide repeat protein, partial [Candidatus Omnitrophica bacterium]|nr:tetratricopeptide repeat protein [Candidatus Omnitrophota bacterium]
VYYHNKGIEFYEQGAYDKAIVELNKALRINPNLALVHYNLANVYLSKGLDAEAIEEYKKVIKLQPQNKKAYLRLVRLFLNKEMYQEASQWLGQAKALVGQDADMEELAQQATFGSAADSLNKGIDSFLKGDKNNAYTLVAEAIKTSPGLAYSYYVLATFYYLDKNLAKAEETLEGLIDQDPRYGSAYALLGDIYFEKGDFTKAIGLYKSAIQFNPGNPNFYNNLGLAYMETEQYSEAAVYLEKALSLDPHNFNILYSLASVTRDSGKSEQATTLYQRLINAVPGYLNAHNDLGDIYKQQGRSRDAANEYLSEISYCEQKLAGDQDNVAFLNSLAYAYAGIGNYLKAGELIKKAIVLAPNYRRAYLTLAHIQELSGDPGGALATLNQARSLPGENNFIDRITSELKQTGSSSNK